MRDAGTIASKTLGRVIESRTGMGFGNGRRITGPAVGRPTILDVSGPSLIRWNQFGNAAAFPSDYIRVTWDGYGGTFVEAPALRTIGPYLWLPARGRYRIANTSNGAFWVGTETLSGTLWERIPPDLALVLMKCWHSSYARPTNTYAGPVPFGTFAFPAGSARNYLFRYSGGLVSNLGVAQFQIAFGNTAAGATFGHPLPTNASLVIPRGQLAGIGGNVQAGGSLQSAERYQ